MIQKHELSVIVRSVGRFMREYVSGAVGTVSKRLDQLEARLNTFPIPRDGRDVDPQTIRQMVTDAIAMAGIPEQIKAGTIEIRQELSNIRAETLYKEKFSEFLSPALEECFRQNTKGICSVVTDLVQKQIPKPEDSSDANQELIERMVLEAVERLGVPEKIKAEAIAIREEVSLEIASLPPSPEDLITFRNSILPVLEEALRQNSKGICAVIADAVKKEMPEPRAGRDADPELIKRMVDEAVEALPKPKDGLDAPPVDIAPLISALVGDVSVEVLKSIPQPKEVDIESIVGRVMERMPIGQMKAEIFEAIPKPKDGEPGRDADTELIKRLIIEAVGALPKPKDGKDVNVEDIRRIITEEVQRSVAAIPPPKDGEPGKDVHPDTVELMVRKAIDALPRPEKGDPGRDAVDLDPLPSVDFSKSYPPGTIALHAGGMIRASIHTIPGKSLAEGGWQVVRNGRASSHYERSEDGRRVTYREVSTDGTVSEQTFKYASMQHRGVYKAGTDYENGDYVTYQGSLWLCIVESTKESPSNSRDWQLIVKAGRDGKDLTPPTPKDPKPPIRLQ